MKKAVSLILALVMCLSLCACGGGSVEPTTEKSPEITAVEEAILGQWVNKDNPIYGFLFTEDNGGVSTDPDREAPITWFFDAEADAYVIIPEGAGENDEVPSIRLEVVDDILCFQLGDYTYVNSETYEKLISQPTEPSETEPVETEPLETKPIETEPTYSNIEITMDNWSEYLEFTSRYEPSVNGFDEVDDVKFYFDICLKEEYLETLDTKNSTITVEISFARGTQYGTFSEDFKVFTPDGEYDKWEGAEKTEIYDFSLCSYGFGACYSLASADFENSSFAPFYPNEQEVLRVSGTLVFN